MKKMILLSLVFVPAMLLASGHADSETSRYFMQTGRDSDFWPRVINFTIFAALIYYLVANPIKAFFEERSKAIASQLDEIEKRLQLAKKEQEDAEINLNASKDRSNIIMEDAKSEIVVLTEKIAKANENDLLILQKQFEEKINLEERKSVRETIDEILSENIVLDDINLNEAKVIDIISKKVA